MTGGPWVVHPYGERAVLIEWPDPAGIDSLRAVLRRHPLAGQVDLVSGARTLLVRLDGPARVAEARQALPTLLRSTAPGPDPVRGDPELNGSFGSDPVVVDTIYDGEDLEEVGRLTGLGAAGVTAAHAGGRWTVAFAGFAPGFGYLTGGDPRLQVVRRPTARTRVPAGAVGLAGEFSGVYPRDSPGGWQLIGRTDAALWRPDRDPPALLRPGMRVRFRAVERFVDRPEPVEGETSEPDGHGRVGLLVLRPGLFTTVQDLGRPGQADLGVGRSGAADRGAAARANATVGNPVGAALLETVLGGLTVRARGEQVLALAGALGPARIGTETDELQNEADQADAGAFDLPDGAELRLSTPASGLRGYLAVRGGIEVPPVLGSRSTDQLSGLGPAPLRAGDLLPVGAGRPNPRAAERGPPRGPVPTAGPVELAVLPGPRSDWFTAAARRRLTGETFTVDPRSNRVGLRLNGPALARTGSGELPPEGLVPGAIQVPPDGQPVLLLADHPVTGGYPVIGVLTDAAIDRAAQLRPGQTVRFAWTS